jgi:hypothetical protein
MPAPGKSPFSCKGHVYVAAQTFYDERVPGGWRAVLDAAQPAALREFGSQLFLAGALYDVLPIVALSETAAHLSGSSHRQLVMENARWVARRDMTGTYRLLLKLAAPGIVAPRLPRVSMRYFDFGGASAEKKDDRCFAAVQTGVPEPLADWMAWCVDAFVPVVLEATGAKDVVVRRPTRATRDGERDGVPTVSLHWEIAWR